MTERSRPRLAVIVNSYGPFSHGECIATKLMEGLAFDDHFDEPRCDVVAMHLLQIAEDDIGVEKAANNGVPLYHSVAAALCEGGDELSVDGVVVVGEHGEFPYNAKGQKLYPRRELFDQIVGVFRQAGRVVPVFNDKHFSWNWAWAKHMWRTVHEMGIPWMAGSSLPFTPFEPAVALPDDDPIDHVVSFGFGDLEHYGYHALETAQFVLERRLGGESGVARVECIGGPAVWEEYEKGRWPKDVCEAAFAAVHTQHGRPQDHAAVPHTDLGMVIGTLAFDVTYRDGLRLTVFILNGYCQEFGFAYRLKGRDEIVATSKELDEVPRLNHMSALVRAIEDMMLTGVAPIPPERTYLVTGVVAALADSYALGAPVETPELDIAYKAMPVPESWPEVLRPAR
ncbi:MAG: hypothetical protein QOK43_263 [Acidimicrobiaceae bacterium]|nr:hypothetical protein [Acidimicrobiaceae bacterium]MDQ1444034.1 hypothetical protein [Acidimicrobiaceae bacterium]